MTVTRRDRLARSTRDLLNTLAAITEKKVGFRSLGDTWADTGTRTRRLMIAVLGGLADVERDLIRTRTAEGRGRAQKRGQLYGPTFETHGSAEDRGTAATSRGRNACRTRPQLRRRQEHDFATVTTWPRHARFGIRRSEETGHSQ
jgi:DNA invertase Pin-like site-specific DNA recombinase